MSGYQRSLRIASRFGYLTANEVVAIGRYAFLACESWHDDQLGGRPVIVNIGAGSGTSGLAIYEGAASQTIRITIDISAGRPEGGIQNERNAFSNFQAPLGDYPTQIIADSPTVAFLFSDLVVDMLFVDGGHMEDEIKADLDAWCPKVRKYILLHDYGSDVWPSVKYVADTHDVLSNEFSLIEVVDTVAVFERKGAPHD